MMTDRYQALLKQMLVDMEAAPRCFQPTQFWKSVIPAIVKDFETFGFENFKNTKSAHSVWVEVGNWELAQEDYDTFLTYDRDENPPHLQAFSESLVGSPVESFQFDGRFYTPTPLNYLRGLAFLKRRVDTSLIHTVMEIGGGYGSLGEIFLKATPENYFYINVDLPPLAAAATYYLQTVFGKEAILDYSQSREMEVIDIEKVRQNYRGMVLCPWQLPKLKGQVDLAVNFISFQEMEPDVVKNYVTYIDALTKHYVLLRNSRYGKPLMTEDNSCGVLEQTTREHYLDYLSAFNLVDLNSNIFGYVNLQGFESEVMIFQRKS